MEVAAEIDVEVLIIEVKNEMNGKARFPLFDSGKTLYLTQKNPMFENK
jgi:hypothetical protein